MFTAKQSKLIGWISLLVLWFGIHLYADEILKEDASDARAMFIGTWFFIWLLFVMVGDFLIPMDMMVLRSLCMIPAMMIYFDNMPSNDKEKIEMVNHAFIGNVSLLF